MNVEEETQIFVNECNVCKQPISRALARMAETSPSREDEIENMVRNCQRQFECIGVTFHHFDGTFCDEELYKLERL